MRKSGFEGLARFLFFQKRKAVFIDNANSHLGTECTGKLMRRYAVPCIISLLVGALYNIVDQIFIANASYLGSYGNAANTVVFPLTVVALAIAVMVGDGCCAFVSMALGRNEKDRARKSVGKALAPTMLSMFREVVFGVGFALLLPMFFGLDGVLSSMPVSDILTFFFSAVIMKNTYRELSENAGASKIA